MKKNIAILLALVLLLASIPVFAMAASCKHENAYFIGPWGMWRCNDCSSWHDSDPRVCTHKNQIPDPSFKAAAAMWGVQRYICADCGAYCGMK